MKTIVCNSVVNDVIVITVVHPVHVVGGGSIRLIFVNYVVLKVYAVSIIQIGMVELRVGHNVAGCVTIKCVWVCCTSVIVPTEQCVVGIDVVRS